MGIKYILYFEFKSSTKWFDIYLHVLQRALSTEW